MNTPDLDHELRRRGLLPPADDADRVHITVLLDRSGSMASIADDTIGGFNTFLAEQRALAGAARISLVQFDSQDPQEVVADAVPVAELVDLTADVYEPRGMTPLLDALGNLIGRLDRRVAADPGEHQLIAVMTDGLENASSDFDRARIAGLVKERSDAGWAFVFLGANIDSYAESGRIGMARSQTADWDHTGAGVRDGFTTMSDASRAYRAAAPSQRHLHKDTLLDEVRPDRDRPGSDRPGSERPRRTRRRPS